MESLSRQELIQYLGADDWFTSVPMILNHDQIQRDRIEELEQVLDFYISYTTRRCVRQIPNPAADQIMRIQHCFGIFGK